MFCSRCMNKKHLCINTDENLTRTNLILCEREHWHCAEQEQKSMPYTIITTTAKIREKKRNHAMHTANKYAQSGSMNTHNTHSKIYRFTRFATKSLTISKIALNNNSSRRKRSTVFRQPHTPNIYRTAKHPREKNQYEESEKSRTLAAENERTELSNTGKKNNFHIFGARKKSTKLR